MCALLESAWNLLQSLYNITYLILGMLLHYLEKLIITIFCRYSVDMEKIQTNWIFVAPSFVIHPQILIFLVFKEASFLHNDCK